MHGSHVCPITFIHPKYILFFLLISILTTCAPEPEAFSLFAERLVADITQVDAGVPIIP